MKSKKFLFVAFLSIIVGMTTSVFLTSALELKGIADTDIKALLGKTGLSVTDSDKSATYTCEDVTAEGVSHTHGYNNSTTPDSGYESYLWVKKLRIYLHDDFMANVNLSTLDCSTPNTTKSYVSCDGGTSTWNDGSDYATIEFVQDDSSEKYPYVEWTYKNEDNDPFLPGNNETYKGDSSWTTDDGRTITEWTDNDKRFYETLAYYFQDGVSGSATTTAATYVQFKQYDTSCGDWEDTKNCWENVEEDGETDFHWNTETNTVTSNVACEAGCALMTITPDEVGVDNLFTSTDFEINAYDKDGNDITSDLDDGYNYEATGDGYFKFTPFQITKPQSKTTKDSTFTYAKAGASDLFTVEAVGYEDTCNVKIEFPYCADLSITKPKNPGMITGTNYSTNIDVSVTASNGEAWPFDLTYSSYDGLTYDTTSTFDGTSTNPYTTPNTTVAYSNTESAQVNVTADHDTAKTCNDTFSYTLRQPAVNYCTDITLSDPDSNNCWSYTVNGEGITPTVYATGYTDSTKSSIVNGVTVTPDSGGLTGKICWPTYTKGNYLYANVIGESFCDADYVDTSVVTPPVEVTPPGGGAPTGGNNNGGSNGGSNGGITITPATPVITNSEMHGTLSKYIYTFNFADAKDATIDNNIYFSHDEDYSFYTLEYDPDGGENSITFNDTMWNEDLGGYLGDGTASSGYITLADRSEIDLYSYKKIGTLGLTEDLEKGSSTIGDSADENGKYWIPYLSYDNGPKIEIPACSGGTDLCYDSSYEPTEGSVVIDNVGEVPDDAVIRVRYVGRVHATTGLCDGDDPCKTETFDNSGLVETGSETVMAEAKLVVLCSYLVTRNAGDVYLEQTLPSGTDISCIDGSYGSTSKTGSNSDYANIEGIIVQENDSSSASDFCTDASSSNSFISNLSSYVCEIVSAVSDLWQSDSIATTTEQHVSEEIRNYSNDSEYSGQAISDWVWLYTYFINNNNEDSNILYHRDTVDGEKVTLRNIEVPSGAWTVIVENADLVLNGNITYAQQTDINKEIPSIAFVVLGGNIYVGNTTKILNGVYYTNKGFYGDYNHYPPNNSPDTGERSAVNGQLTIYGSIYGDVSELLKAANYVGSPNLDGGGIVVRYDSRILLNTPPGLGEYIDVNSEKAVN